MNTYIALLRGINVGGQKKIKMAELRSVLENMDLKNVQTYIQSGNIVFGHNDTDTKALEIRVHDKIEKHFGFDVPVLILESKDVGRILNESPFEDDGDNKLYYVLLKNAPNEGLKAAFNNLQFDQEDFHITDTCVYLFCRNGYGNAKLNNNLIERKLNVEATTRNHKTMLKLLELST
ncbi:DUF1697 domain-containing protein [Flagellimonas beolgyonensis]|uniref:DUF1697 domain-containing protein n=1 Tax=Flagellimonas beolgyonensis TaxID=864064 RepID=UPI000F8D789D|nr:DUF1697 domain-containing protein [Allomuricauda beolgyonensis]